MIVSGLSSIDISFADIAGGTKVGVSPAEAVAP